MFSLTLIQNPTLSQITHNTCNTCTSENKRDIDMRWVPKLVNQFLYRNMVTSTLKIIGKCHEDFPHPKYHLTTTHIETPSLLSA